MLKTWQSWLCQSRDEVPSSGDQSFLQLIRAEVIVFRWGRTVSSCSHTPTLTQISSDGLGQVLHPGEKKIKISLFPLSGTGNTVIEAVKVLVEHGVQPSVIILLSLFSTPHGKLRGCGGDRRASTGTFNGEELH